MQSQQRLRDELQFVTEFHALFDVMQHVAIARLHRAESAMPTQVKLTPILVKDIFPLLPVRSMQQPSLRGGVRGRLLVVITSDEGFVGPLYANVIREALRAADDKTQWLLVGGRSVRLLGERAARAQVIPIPSDEESAATMQRVGDMILARYRREALRDVWLIAPRFLSMARQDIVRQRLLPLPLEETQRVEREDDVILEPSLDEVMAQLERLWVVETCVEAFWSARRAEWAARALHVEASRQELTKHAQVVHHEFCKTRHERVDALVRETCLAQQLFRTRAAARPFTAGSHR